MIVLVTAIKQNAESAEGTLGNALETAAAGALTLSHYSRFPYSLGGIRQQNKCGSSQGGTEKRGEFHLISLIQVEYHMKHIPKWHWPFLRPWYYLRWASACL